MKIIRIVLFIVVSSVLTISCENEIIEEPISSENITELEVLKTNSQDVTWFTFDSMEELNNFFPTLAKFQNDEQSILQSIKSHYGIVPLLEVFNEGSKIINVGLEKIDNNYDQKNPDIEKALKEVDIVYKEFYSFVAKYPHVYKIDVLEDEVVVDLPTSYLWSYLLNADGMLQIGDTIYKLTENGSFLAISRYNYENINSFDDSQNVSMDSKDLKSAFTSQYTYNTDYIPGHSDRRMVSRLYYFENAGHNRTIEAQTSYQRKGIFGQWYNPETRSVSVISHPGNYSYLSVHVSLVGFALTKLKATSPLRCVVVHLGSISPGMVYSYNVEVTHRVDSHGTIVTRTHDVFERWFNQ